MSHPAPSDPGQEVPPLLAFQLDLLKEEIETIDSSIRQMDVMTEKVKSWCVVIWAAAIGAAISQEKLNPYIVFTAFIPLVFWFVDTWYRRIQRKFIFRTRQITDFLNGEDLAKSFELGRITGTTVFDPVASLSRGPEFDKFVSWRLVLFFPSLCLLYIGLIAISVVAWVLKAFVFPG